LAGVVVAVALAGCGGGAPATGTGDATGSNAAASTTPTTHPTHPRRAGGHHVPPALAHLRAALRKDFAEAGRDTGALVYDLVANKSLFALRDGVKRPPASVEKLYTTTAAIDLLGTSARFHTDVLGAGHMGAHGVWHGDLYLRGGGDPTLGDGSFNKIWEEGYGPTAGQIAAELRHRGLRRITGQLIGDESLFDQRRGGPATGYGPDTPDFGGQLSALTYDHGAVARKLTPGAFAARQLARTLRAQHVAVRAAPKTARTPLRAHKLASVSSPPLSVLLRLTDIPSDDLFAEMLTKQLGVRFGSGGTITAGARVIRERINSFGIHPKIVDGSGLSRADESSPAEVVALLRILWHTDIGRVLEDSLPVVGVNGTTAQIGVKTAAQGHCVAKTGTLNYVTNLAGYCATRGRRMVAFTLFIDGPANWQATEMLSRMVGAIAQY
jgi:D-alanyl-D-alanine carboxypeptidase/D-alanyl-D-alanine-endopeptidase (penicillin-binding protein 4)